MISFISSLLKIISLFEAVMAAIRLALYNKAIEGLERNAKSAASGPIADREKAAKAIEDFYNSHAPLRSDGPNPPTSS